jgi:MFS family permease
VTAELPGAALRDPAIEEPRVARPTALLPLSHLVQISAFWLGLTAIDAAWSLFVQLRLTYSDLRGDVGLGLASAIVAVGGGLVSIAVQPTIGSISDYTASRWGRRKPWIVIGSLLNVVFLVGVAYSNSLAAVVAFVILLNFSTSIARGPFQGYVPDLVAESQVGLASAMVGLMQIAGNIVGFGLASGAAALGNLPLALLAVAVVELVTMVAVVVRVGAGLPPRPRHGRSWPSIALDTWGPDILRARSFVWLVASRLFFLMAGGILFAFAAAYLKYEFGYTESQAGVVFVAMLAAVGTASAASVVPASKLSDRIGRKPVIYAACVAGAVGAAVVAVSPFQLLAIAGAALFGIAAGTFLSVDWALMTDIIPRESAGRYMGMSNVATGSAPLFAAALGGLVLDWVTTLAGPAAGPRAAFLLAVALYGVAAVLLVPVVEPPRRGTRSAAAIEPGTGAGPGRN